MRVALLLPLLLAALVTVCFATFILLPAPAYVTNPQTPPFIAFPDFPTASTETIPAVIIQCGLDPSCMPATMKHTSDTIRKTSPGFEYKYFTDQGMLDFVVSLNDKAIIQAYMDLRPGAYKADLFRYLYLYHHGGIYIDMGFTIHYSLKPLTTGWSLVTCEDEPGLGIYQAFLAVIPRHPLIKDAVDRVVKNTQQRLYGITPLSVTGPRLIGSLWVQRYGAIKPGADDKNRILLLSHNECFRFYKTLFFQGRPVVMGKYRDYKKDWAEWSARDSPGTTYQSYHELWHKRSIYNPRTRPVVPQAAP
jgi:mannosyltransferase OCH1-like enzyme